MRPRGEGAHDGALESLRQALRRGGGEGDRSRRARAVAERIREAGPYRWVGIYDVGPEEIAAVAWTGADAPAYPSFSRDRGLCGAAVAAGETVAVGDVTKDPRYLTTFGSTRSEIVVPIRGPDGAIAGLLDVESERIDAFGEEDRRFLEACAAALGELWR